MKNILFVIFVGLLILPSCQKREEKTFTVKIYNPVTDELYENIGVVIIERPNKTTNYTTESSVFYEGFTDANGEVMITGEFHKGYAYQLLTGSPEGVTICDITAKHQGRNSGPGLQLDRQNLHGSTAYVELTPCASLKLKINNINCQGSSDKMILYQGNEVGNIDMTDPWQHDGCVNWETNGNSSVTMGEQYYRWEVTRSGVTETFYDTIYLEAGEQRIYEINY